MPAYIRTRSEFTVNSYTADDQTGPSVATFADGGFVVSWVTGDTTQDGNRSAIKAQLFDSAGSKVGPEFLVNSAASGQQFTPRVETLGNGNFVITWVTNVSEDGTNGIKAQLFDRSGAPIGGEFKVNTAGTSLFEANVTSLADGRFIISWDDWSSQSVKGQIFDSSGARIGGNLTLAYTSAQGYGDIVGLANGGFVATFRDTSTSWDVRAQIFDASGAKVGGAFLVNTVVAGSQNSPRATALADGGFVITWSESNPEYQSGNTRIKAQVYTAAGVKVGGEVLVSTTTAYSMGSQVVTALPDGGFLIAWHTTNLVTGGGSDSEVRAQRFTATGAKVDGEFMVNTLTTGSQWIPDLATLADGRVIAVWASGSGDIAGQSIRAQILGTELAAPLPNTAPVIITNGGGDSVALTQDEGLTAVTRVVASDDGEPNNLRYSITGGADAALFTINALTGILAFKATPDHVEGADNIYDVTVTASDGQLSDSQSFQISLRHVNYVTIVSDGGYDYADIWVDENQTDVTIVTAVDDDGVPLTYSITGGEDAAFFTIDSQTGELRFTAMPDYERPHSTYGDNLYYIQVTATDGVRSDHQDIRVHINDVVEPEGFAIVSDGAGDYAQISVPENGTAVTTVVVSAAAGPVTYEIVGGSDASWFEIDSETGALSFVGTPNFEVGKYPPYYPYYYGEVPDYYNLYNVIVRASDGESFDEQELEIRVVDVDEAPEFGTYRGDAEVAMTIAENTQPTFSSWAEDPDRFGWVTYGLDGPDAHLFETDPYNGGLRVRVNLDYEAPVDADGDNVYQVSVVAMSDGLSSTQSFSITVENDWEPVTFTSHDGTVARVYVPENRAFVTYLTATGDGPIYYEIIGGEDSDYFTLDPYTGELSFRSPPNYEGYRDHRGDGHVNSYDLVVVAYNNGSYDEQHLLVRVEDIDEAPRLNSYGGWANVAVTASENVTTFATVNATDPERSGVTYAIAGGADAGLFAVDSYSGALRFKQGPDFEAPADSDHDNVYQVTVSATSDMLGTAQSFTITIADVNENVAITSNGGGDSAAVSVAENGTAVTRVIGASGLAVTYSIVGGADAADFTINLYNGTLAFASAPNFEWTADSDHDNVYEVIVRASNGVATDDQHISVTLTDVDENPDFFDHEPGIIEIWGAENRAYVGVVQAYDIDGGPAITHSVTGGADGALFVIDPVTGELSFADFAGPDFEAPADADGDNRYEVEVTAFQGSWSRARTFTVTIDNENEQPRITSNGGGTSAAIEMDEGQTAVTTVTSVDDGPNPVSYSITGGPHAELFAIDAATGALSFVAAPDHEAPAGESSNFYTVEVTASDGLLSSFQKVQVLVRNVNEGVTISTGPALSVDENSAFVARVAAADVDGDPLSYAIVGGADASHFVIDPATGDLTIRASLDFEAPADADGDNVYEVIVRASDGQLSDDRQMSITVNDVEELEIVSYGGAGLVSLTVPEHSFQIADVDANLSPFWGVTFAVSGADAALFTVDRHSGELRFNYPFLPDFEVPGDADGDNVYDVTVTASTATSSDSQTFAITVADLNEGLWITSNDRGDATITLDEGDRHVTTVTAHDQDGDVPVFSILGGADAALFAIDAATGVLTFIAAPDYEAPANAAGYYLVEVGASDGEFTARQRLRVEIDNVNEGVTITSGGGAQSLAVSVGENGLAVTNVTASDVDGDVLTYSIAGGADAARFTIDAATGALRFVQAPNFEAPADSGGDNIYDVVVSASDGSFTDSQDIQVWVVNVLEGVTINSYGGADIVIRELPENGAGLWTVAAVDGDGDPISYSLAGEDAALFAIDSSGNLSFVGAPDFEAPADLHRDNDYLVTVVASTWASSDTQTFGIRILNVDEPVTITSNGGGSSAAVSVAENGTAVTVVAARDADGGPVTYAIAGGADASRFTIDAATGLLAFIAPPNFEAAADSGGNNVYDVIVSASDGSLTDTQAIAVTVGNVNEAPIVTSGGGGSSGALSVAENSLTAAVVTAADPDGSSATYSIVGGADAARFTINAQTGALQFVAAPDWELPSDSNKDNVYSVVVRASDGQLFDEQALSITVTNTRDGNNVTGTSGGDSISATSTNAALRTSNEEDLVFGRDGHDTIQGMAGDDELYGEGGNDVLIGGDGADRLLGGVGKDQFTYNALSESAGALRDLIMDFSRAQGDKISLSAIDANSLVSNNQAFTFIGTSAFSNVAGQLRYETSGGVTTVSGDVNGDGVADLQIQLSGTVTLIASDFIL